MKFSLEYVDAEVDKLYNKSFDLSDISAANKHCEFIVAFINACGYSEEEYTAYVMGLDSKETMN